MPADRTRCFRGNLGRFEEHSVPQSCVWGERCRGNPRLEQNKTEDAWNKIFWGWIVISCCKMCLLLYKNEAVVELLLPFLKSGIFLCMMHISLCHNTLLQKRWIFVRICCGNQIHIFFFTLWVKSFVFNILLLETILWTHVCLFIFALCLPTFLSLFLVWSRGEKGNQGSFPPVWKKTTQTPMIMSSSSVWDPDNSSKLLLLNNTYNRYTDIDEDSRMAGV